MPGISRYYLSILAAQEHDMSTDYAALAKQLAALLVTEVARGDEDKGEPGHVRSCPNMGAPNLTCSDKCRRIGSLVAQAGTGL